MSSLSDVWQYYEKIGDKAKCKICKQEYARSQGSTQSMWKHLKSKHYDVYLKIKGIGEENCNKQQKIDIFTKPKLNEKEIVEEQIASIMLRQNNAFSFFDDPNLKMIVSKAYPHLQIGGSDHFRRIVFPRMADKVQNKIKHKIGGSFFSLTSDGWSQPSRTPQLQSITIHCISPDFSRHDFVLRAFTMGNLRHTGENISSKIEESMNELGFLLENCLCIVRDDAANMQLATQLLKIPSFQCCAHFLHLNVEKALQTDFVQEIIRKVISWVKFCRTTNGKSILKRHQKQQNAPEKQLIMCIKTRWNSVFHMLQVFRENKKVLLSMDLERQQKAAGIFHGPKRPRLQGADAASTELPQLTLDDFTILKRICPILKIFESETLKFSKEQSIASSIIPTLKKIGQFLCECETFHQNIEPFIQNLSEAVGTRLRKLADNKTLQMATLLDPRFGYSEDYFSKFIWSTIEEDILEFAREKLTKIVEQNDNEQIINESVNETNENCMNDLEEPESSDGSINYDIWKPKSPAAISLPSTISAEDALSKRIQVQLSVFRTIERPNSNENVFEWWKRNAAQFPDLSSLAKIFLAIPATSISSERLFSKAGLIYSNTLRNRLSAEMAEKILVVKANLDTIYLAPNFEDKKEDPNFDNEISFDFSEQIQLE